MTEAETTGVDKTQALEAVGEGLADRGHQRETLAMVRRAHQKGWINFWTINEEVFKKMPNIVIASIARSQQASDERSLLAGVSLMRGFVKDNAELAEVIEKAERLDDGDPTEVVAHTVLRVTFDT